MYGFIWLNKYSFFLVERLFVKENKRNIYFFYVEIKDIKFVFKCLLVCVFFFKIGGRFVVEKIVFLFWRMLMVFFGLVNCYFINKIFGCIVDSLKWWYFWILESGEKFVDRNVF